jgi:hypothetical protein
MTFTTLPGFVAAARPSPPPVDAIVPAAWYCCIIRQLYGVYQRGVVGCRGHNTWYPFALVACSAEALVRGDSSTLLSGTCSARPECAGKIL